MMRQFRGRTLMLAALAVTLTGFVATELDARGRGGGRGGGGGFSRSGPAAGGSIGAHRQGGIGSGGFSRRDVGGDRSGARRNVGRERREVRGDVRSERREHHEWYEDRWKRRAGAMLTATAFAALSCNRTTVFVNGVTYSSCGGNWYSRAYNGGSVTYVIVSPPPGY